MCVGIFHSQQTCCLFSLNKNYSPNICAGFSVFVCSLHIPTASLIPQCTCTSVQPSGTAAACVWRQRGSSSVAGAVGKEGVLCGTTALPSILTPPAGWTCPVRMWSAPTHASLRSVPIILCLSFLPACLRTSSSNQCAIISCHVAASRPSSS